MILMTKKRSSDETKKRSGNERSDKEVEQFGIDFFSHVGSFSESVKFALDRYEERRAGRNRKGEQS